MEIRKVSVSAIKPVVYNPRKDLRQGDAEYEKIKKSIMEFGYIDPLIWNEATGSLVGGHQRLKILIEQGVQEVDVSVVNLSLEREKALNLALNKVQGDWDNDKLAVLLDELTKIPDFDMGLTGFDLPEISNIFDNYLTSMVDVPVEAVEAIVEPVTKRGDLILLGPHRLLCGDSSNPEDVAKLIGDSKIDLLFTDPPYNVAYSYQNRPVSIETQVKTGERWQKLANDNMSQDDYEVWLNQVFTNINPYLARGMAFYIWNGHRQFGPMHQMLLKLGFHVSCVITWAKESFSPGYGDFNQQTEFCLYGFKEDNGAHNWYGPNNETTLWQVHREPAGTTEHPTQKPVVLVERAIKNSSKRGGRVVDLFLGSGTTLIASERLGRVCYGMELDPRFFDLAVRRYIRLVGEDKVSPEVRRKYLEGGNHGKA